MTPDSSLRFALAAWLCLFIAACASTVPAPSDPQLQHTVVLEALGQVGRPYRYGGTTPEGFDCSGLVQFAYAQAGVKLPRSTREQYRVGTPVDRTALEPGDLLFYRFNSGPVDHVALYLGDGEAIHAPASGRAVIVAGVDLPYWQNHFVQAVRVLH
ncbi:NlpC/P60 family protein [Sinimarinibacterium sp. CAU 1509]|uniref:C40 family peptidase n=1 Tax=Sinimarinibacterium sp. CAU 1509 TaxID=2562283 RepID=UPI0010AC7511|nr:C40 family peptidase [Sinimarinibacterium sp. CAU 1509]TJY62130.1 NlpC/P60 family protein [Sinimarinibacterium sp. CAU 1509]